MTRYFRQLRHLLPSGEPWRVIVDNYLRQFFEGVSVGAQSDAVDFVDQVYLDLFPDTTRELEDWERQFNLPGTGPEATRRAALAARWMAQGGQDPTYIESIFSAAGFDLEITPWWNDDTSAEVYSFTAGNSLTLTPVPSGAYMRDDGLRFYFIDTAFALREYTMTTAWDVASAVETASISISLAPLGIDFSPDGKRFYVTQSAHSRQYDMAIPWDIANAVLDAGPWNHPANHAGRQLRWRPDGRRLFLSGIDPIDESIWSFDVSEPWDLQSTLAKIHTLDIDSDVANGRGFAFLDQGYRLAVANSEASDSIEFWSMTNRYDLDTASKDGNLVISSDVANPWGVDAGHKSKSIFVFDVATPGVFRYRKREPLDPRTLVADAGAGHTQCGETGDSVFAVAECGEQPPNQDTELSAVCDFTPVGDQGYWVNSNGTDWQGQPLIPDDENKWPFFMYLSAARGFPLTVLDVEIDRKPELRELALRLCPTQHWIAYGDGVNFMEAPMYITLATNEPVSTDATEVVIGGGYLDGGSGKDFSWEVLGIYNDNAGAGNQNLEARLYDRGPDGTPTAGTLRSTLIISALDTLDRVSQVLTANGSPGVDVDQIQDAPRMYEVRLYLDATGGVDDADALQVRFNET